MIQVKVSVKVEDVDRLSEIDNILVKASNDRATETGYDFRTNEREMFFVGLKSIEEAKFFCKILEDACQEYGVECRTEILSTDDVLETYH